MRIYTKTTKVLNVSKNELDSLQDMIQEARSRGRAERPVGPYSYFAVEVVDVESNNPTRISQAPITVKRG